MTTPISKILEAVLFLADEPVSTSDLAVLLEAPAAQIERALEDLAARYREEDRGIVMRKVAGGWRLATAPEAAPYLERFVRDQAGVRLSRPSLETLAIIAYRQPVSRAQIADIRGVNSDRALRTLLLSGVVEEVGREDGPGRAILYGTGRVFLERLGLNSISELPPLSEFLPGPEEVDRMESGLSTGL